MSLDVNACSVIGGTWAQASACHGGEFGKMIHACSKGGRARARAHVNGAQGEVAFASVVFSPI